jgi:hypothetical protein
MQDAPTTQSLLELAGLARDATFYENIVRVDGLHRIELFSFLILSMDHGDPEHATGERNDLCRSRDKIRHSEEANNLETVKRMV